MSSLFPDERLNKRIKVPPSPKLYRYRPSLIQNPPAPSGFKHRATNYPFSVGDKVKWNVYGRRRNSHPLFTATGRILKIYTSTFGGKVEKPAAQIATSGEYQNIFPNRRKTTVAVDKLQLDN